MPAQKSAWLKIVFLFAASPMPACAASNWNLLTQSTGGVISLMRNLSESECEHAKSLILGAPFTEKEKESVQREFETRMAKEWMDLARQKEWQKAHPQCKHVEWWKSWGVTNGGEASHTGYSNEDLSGQNGKCSVDGRGPMWHGTDDSLDNWSPDTNPLIEQTQKDAALRKFGFTTNDSIKSAKCFE